MADGDLLGPAAVREIAARLDVRPAKRLGQNFVIDPGTVRRIVTLAGLSAGDAVLEVGPGFGSLTLGLLRRRAPGGRGRGGPGAGGGTAADRGRRGAGARAAARGGHRRRGPGDQPARRAALGAGGEPALQRRGAGGAAPARHLRLAGPRPGHGAGRGRRPDDRAPGQPGLRRALGQAGVVRVGPAGRRRCPATVFWPVPNVDSGLVAFTRHAGRPVPGPAARTSSP